ncbi:hypothetical protein E4U40_006040 [Claviceps sp. LM458 group G5]|nr:hypothetical protein E4U40_006040 [Claviceps sp. LM458 group G5]
MLRFELGRGENGKERKRGCIPMGSTALEVMLFECVQGSSQTPGVQRRPWAGVSRNVAAVRPHGAPHAFRFTVLPGRVPDIGLLPIVTGGPACSTSASSHWYHQWYGAGIASIISSPSHPSHPVYGVPVQWLHPAIDPPSDLRGPLS